jgi:dTMP kinase
MERVREINKQAVRDTMPDMILFMDLDVDVWLSRTFDGEWDKFEKRKAEFSHKIYEGCEMLFDFPPTKDLMRRVDASGNVEEVFAHILHVVQTVWTTT